MDGWALMESFKEWILGFSDSVKFLGTKDWIRGGHDWPLKDVLGVCG